MRIRRILLGPGLEAQVAGELGAFQTLLDGHTIEFDRKGCRQSGLCEFSERWTE